MSKSIEIDQLADAVMDALEEYRDLAADVVKSAVKDVAEDSVYDMEDSVERASIGGSGAYKNSFAAKKRTEKGAYGYAVYSKPPFYRLTHLLENGHDLKRGGKKVGHVKAFSHWDEVDNASAEKLFDRIKKGLSLFRR